MKKKILYFAVIFILICCIVTISYVNYSNKNAISYLISTGFDSNSEQDIKYTQLFIFNKDVCISNKISVKGYNTSISEIYNPVVEATKQGVAIILNYSEENNELTYEWLQRDIGNTKKNIKEALEENANIKQIIEF